MPTNSTALLLSHHNQSCIDITVVLYPNTEKCLFDTYAHANNTNYVVCIHKYIPPMSSTEKISNSEAQLRLMLTRLVLTAGADLCQQQQ
jgi:hypothetical protein